MSNGWKRQVSASPSRTRSPRSNSVHTCGSSFRQPSATGRQARNPGGRWQGDPRAHARQGAASPKPPASLRHRRPCGTATGGSFSKWERGGAALASEGARETFRWLCCRRQERRPREPNLMGAKNCWLLGALPRRDCVKGVDRGSPGRGLETWRPASGRRSR